MIIAPKNHQRYSQEPSYSQFRDKYKKYLSAFTIMIGDNKAKVPLDFMLWVGRFYFTREQYTATYRI